MDDQAYYLRRAREEEESARIATCRAARGRHDELASAYRFRARLLLEESGGDRLEAAADIAHEPA